MKSFFPTALLGIPLFLLVPSVTQCGAQDQLKQDVVDAFKIFENLDNAVAMLDVDLDGDLDCLVAKRTEFDKNGPSATYVWILSGLNGEEKNNITFHLKPGPSPDKPAFTLGNGGGPEQIANFVFADYQSCAVIQLPYGGGQECMLWVTNETKDNYPQYCVDQYEDNCGGQKIAYDENTCSQLLGSS
uniref:Putative lipocalin-2 1 n=1 Tax=Amblyomma triste TaxID=251400 RepID=A0A023GDM8_AMBTT